MKKRKVLIPVLLGLIFFVIFGVSFFFWKTAWDHSSAGTTNTASNGSNSTSVTTPINQTNNSVKLLTVHSNFYNYRYDDEMKKGTRTQGSQSSDNQYETPYTIFNNKLDWYYRNNGKGITVGLYEGNYYWYWKNKITAGTQYNWDWCINTYTNFYWAANIANRYGEETNSATYAAACQGIVDSQLSNPDSSDILTRDLTNNGKLIPFFNKEFLNWTDDATDTGTKIGAYAENVGFPFRAEWSKEKGNYYVFDSTKDVVRFVGMEGDSGTNTKDSKYYFGNDKKLEYYYNDKQIKFKTSGTAPEKAYFFPYNKSENVVRNPSTNYSNLDYGFGIRLDIPFYVTADGMQDDDGEKKPMKFNFSGDDDVWIFLDGNLVLDLGGDHGMATGYIDFSTGGTENKATAVVDEVSYLKGTDKQTTAKSHCFETNNTYTEQKKQTIPVQKDADHVITIFYMERGMIESNLYMDFSFIPHDAVQPTNTPTPEPTNTPEITATPSSTPATNSTTIPSNTAGTAPTVAPTLDPKELTIKTMVNSTSVAEPFKTTVLDMVEEDGFQYKIQNKGTLASDVGDSGLAYPSGVLSVREHRGKLRYWSFGEKPYVRVYFDLGTSKNCTNNNNRGWDTNEVYIMIDNGGRKYYKMIQYNNTQIYYYDVPLGKKIVFATSETSNYPFMQDLDVSNKNGDVFIVTHVQDNNTATYKWLSDNNASFSPYPSSNKPKYSNNLPYQTKATPAPTYSPTNTNSYNLVKDTAYELIEAYTSTPDTKILINSDKTTGVTNSSGILALLSEDSATFKNQFKKESTLKVVQQEQLACVDFKTPSISVDENGDDDITTFSEGTRSSYDYYYTTFTAKDADDYDLTANINAKGEFVFANSSSATTDTVKVTETFSNTVKTGDIVLEKKLKGCTEKNTNYTFTITFKKIFGGSTPADYTAYQLPYDLYTKNASGEYVKDSTNSLNSNGELSLKADQKAVISGIPAGTKYKIEETANNGTVSTIASSIKVTYDTTTSDNTRLSGTADDVIVTTGQTGSIIGKIPTQVDVGSITSSDFETVEVGVVFTNQAGVLKIAKTASGEWSSQKNADYTFTITDGTTNSSSLTGKAYFIYRENDNAGGSYGTVEGVLVSSGTLSENHQVNLQAGQWVEIHDLPLSAGNGHTYTITENKGYYDLAALRVKQGNATVATANGYPSSVTTAELNSTNPQVDVEFVNRYDKYYIEIEKYVDKLYYTDTEYFYENGSDKKTYQELSNAEQSFIFKVEEYDNSSCSGTASKVFDVTIPVTGAAVLPNPVTPNGSSDEYNYKASKRIQATPGKYYKITEDTGWSWKYSLETVLASDNGTRLAKDNAIAKVENNSVILNGYREGTDSSKPSVPTASFYNKRKNTDVEGDTSFITNIIKSKK